MPDRYPSGSTCWRRLQEWQEAEILVDIWQKLLGTLDEKGRLKWDEVFADGTFSAAKKDDNVGKTKRGKRTKLMVVTEGKACLSALSLLPQRPIKRR